GRAAGGRPRLADGPASEAFDVAFHPPDVENAQARHAIQRRLHTAGAGSLQRKLWCVKPNVHSGSDLSAKLEIVIVKEHDRDSFAQGFFRVENPANDVLPAGIIRMGLAGVDNLEMSRVLGNLPESIEIGQDQVGALVSRRTARETDREDFGIELEPGLLTNRLEQLVLGDQVSCPHFLRGQSQGASQTVIV